MVTAEIWPTLGYSRVPYRLYHDAEIYKQEQERILKGPTWRPVAERHVDGRCWPIAEGRVRGAEHAEADISFRMGFGGNLPKSDVSGVAVDPESRR